MPVLTPQDFASDQDVRWCPGCGDYSILAQMKKVLPTLGMPPREDRVRLRHRLLQPLSVLHEHLRHPPHPRPRAGRGDGPEVRRGPICRSGSSPATATRLSIGGNHLMHAIRRNLDLNIMLFNNRIYGLTKGQYSPTSPLGKVTKSTPMGSIDNPLHPLSLAIGCEATFVARIDRRRTSSTWR